MSASFPEIDPLACKGCARCVDACPQDILRMSDDYNERGYHFAECTGGDCTGCGLCYYTCPEPYAIRVHRAVGKKQKPVPTGEEA